MMIGNLHLTTHRILFHALLPPEAAFVDESSRSSSALHSDQAMAAPAQQPDILHSGPITVHRSGALKSTRRVWLELSAEMITTYPHGDEAGRVRPLCSVLCESLAEPTANFSELRETARSAGPEASM
jgi:sterol 3beta-glucosyltransferase